MSDMRQWKETFLSLVLFLDNLPLVTETAKVFSVVDDISVHDDTHKNTKSSSILYNIICSILHNYILHYILYSILYRLF